MPFPSYDKDPNSLLDYRFEWEGWLQEGEVIASVSITKVGSDLVIADQTWNDSTSVTVWVSGGRIGQYTTVTVQITTNQGRRDNRSILLVIKER